MKPENILQDKMETISIQKIKDGGSVVLHQGGMIRSLPEEIQSAISECYRLPHVKAKDYDVQKIYCNCDTILTFVDFVSKVSPCDRNVYDGVEKIIEEFNDTPETHQFRHFLPVKTNSVLIPKEYADTSGLTEDLNELSGLPRKVADGFRDKGKGVMMKDGSWSNPSAITSDKPMYESVHDYLEALQKKEAEVLPPGYMIRTSIQMLMTLMKYVCDNQIIIRRCAYCGKLFEAPHASRKYCSKKCALAAKKEQSRKSAEKEDVQAVYNFRQVVKKRFQRYCQGKTHMFNVDTLKIPASMTAVSDAIEKAVQNRNLPAFENALEDLIEAQKSNLSQEEYINWLETAGRKRGSHVGDRIQKK